MKAPELKVQGTQHRRNSFFTKPGKNSSFLKFPTRSDVDDPNRSGGGTVCPPPLPLRGGNRCPPPRKGETPPVKSNKAITNAEKKGKNGTGVLKRERGRILDACSVKLLNIDWTWEYFQDRTNKFLRCHRKSIFGDMNKFSFSGSGQDRPAGGCSQASWTGRGARSTGRG